MLFSVIDTCVLCSNAACIVCVLSLTETNFCIEMLQHLDSVKPISLLQLELNQRTGEK